MIKKVSNEYFLGIDIGTGSTKAVAVNKEGKPLEEAQFFYPTTTSQKGYSEQDPELIWEAFVKCIQEIITQKKQVPVTVSLSCCMHSLIIMDSQNKAITPLITWADTRSEKIAEELRKSKKAKSIYELTGTPIHSMSPLCKIAWFRKNEKKIFENAFKFISIKEFIWYRLFNIYEIDTSIASATGLFNIINFNWNTASLKICGITPAQLSALVPTDHLRNHINTEIAGLLNIPSTTNFCIGASDGCLANIGSYAISPGIAALTIGTSGAVRIASGKPVLNFKAMIFNYVLDEKTFISGGPINNGGIVIKWLFKTFLKNANPSDADYEILFKNISAIPAGSEGLIFLPYLYGERAPVWDENACGVFFGIKPHHTINHFLKAGVEGVCFALNNILQIMETSTHSIKQLNVSGGFVNSPTWIQILADITGKKICLTGTEDASSIGAAILAMRATKMISSYALSNTRNEVIIKPDKKAHLVYEKYFEVYKALYEPLEKSMHQLKDIAGEVCK